MIEPPSPAASLIVVADALGLSDQVKITLDGRTKFVSSIWLRLYARPRELYVDVAADWTDGANFAPETRDAVPNVQLVSVAVQPDLERMVIEWSDGFEGWINTSWLAKYLFGSDPVEEFTRASWDGTFVPCTMNYKQVMEQDDALYELLADFWRHGLVLVEAAPTHVECVRPMAARLGTLLPTHLGEVFHLRSTGAPQHIGETSDSIPLHIDFAYKSEPPRVQVLHALQRAPTGGANVFVDGLRVFEELSDEHRRLLANTVFTFEASSTAVWYLTHRPILARTPDGGFAGLSYNEYKVSYPCDISDSSMDAIAKFQEVSRSPRNQLSIRLRPGVIAVFDNSRVLHGREEFGPGERHVVGGFIVEDDMRSRFRVLSRAIGRGEAPT